jgi:hypothetical protein
MDAKLLSNQLLCELIITLINYTMKSNLNLMILHLILIEKLIYIGEQLAGCGIFTVLRFDQTCSKLSIIPLNTLPRWSS